jgi:hypothetical protein
MTSRTADVPAILYVLATLVGACGLPLSFAVLSYGYGAERVGSDFLNDFLTLLFGREGSGAWLAGVLVFAVPQGFLGLLFGAAVPEVGWRWGVWLTALPLCLLTFFVPAVGFFLSAVALSTLPSCVGAYAGARLPEAQPRVI